MKKISLLRVIKKLTVQEIIFIFILLIIISVSIYYITEYKIENNNEGLLKNAQITSILTSAFLIIISLLAVSLYRNNQIKSKSFDYLQKTLADLKTENRKLKNSSKSTFIKIDDSIKTAIRQYLVFFTDFVDISKQVKIKINVQDVKNGLDISFDLPDSINLEEFDSWLSEYLNFLIIDKNEIKVETNENTTIEEVDILILKLKNEKSHFEQAVKVLQIEKEMLQNENAFLRDLTKIIGSKSTQFFLQSGNDSLIRNENYNNIQGSQIIGNNNSIQVSNFDKKLMDLIIESSKEKEEVKYLQKQIAIIKSKENKESTKLKAGAILKNFLINSTSEVAKELIKFIFENGQGWWKYISTNL